MVAATKEAPKTEVKEKPKFPIPEDTDFKIVKFMNLEQRGVPLEFSAGAPMSQEIRNYVLKDGHCYKLPKRVRAHILSADLAIPKFENVEDPSNPGTFRSMEVRRDQRFALSEVEDLKGVIVYEHIREKLNHRVKAEALKNAPYAAEQDESETIKEYQGMTLEKQHEMMADNETLIKQNANLIKTSGTTIEAINELKKQITTLKGQQTVTANKLKEQVEEKK